MQSIQRYALIFSLVFGSGLVARAGTAYQSSEGRRPWYSFRRPAMEDPVRQLAHARELREDKPSRAIRQYRALVACWPSAPEAASAQYELGRTLEQQGRTQESFDAYALALERYGAALPYHEIYERQFALAKGMLKERGMRWLFGGYEMTEQALPMLEKLLTLSPKSEHAPEIQFRIGEAKESLGEWSGAIDAYTRVVFEYSPGFWTVEAAYRRATALSEVSRRTPNDGGALDNAWHALTYFVRTFPDDSRVAKIEALRTGIQTRRADHAYEMAQHYDRSHRAAAARAAYESFLKQFPDAEQSGTARARVAALTESKPENRP